MQSSKTETFVGYDRWQMQLNSTGKDQYEFRMYRQSIWFGVKDNLLYISNNERLADEAGRRYGVSLQNTPWAGQVTKNRFFMAFNAAQLVKDVQENPRLTRMLGSDAPCSMPSWDLATIWM